jgi:hypothetical protein
VEVTQTSIMFDCPVPPWTVLVAAAILLGILVFFLRRDTAQLARRWRVLIMALLATGFLMVVGLALCPTVIRTWPDTAKPRCAVLVDGSRSMMTEDAYDADTVAWLSKRLPAAETAGGKVRRDAIARALTSGGPTGWMATVAPDFDLVGWRFAGTTESLALGEGAAPFAVDPQGYTTALGDALDAAAAGAGSDRPRAVVLVSDGAWNIGRDPAEVGNRLGRQGTAVFALSLGDPNPPKDVTVQNLRGPASSLLGDAVVLTAHVAASGLGALRLPVELVSGGTVLETKHVAVPPSGQLVTISFTYVPETPGRAGFEVRVPRQEGEKNEANNSASLVVDIIEQKINVLLIDAEPRWEFRFIRNVMERDSAVNLTVCLLRPGVGPLSGDRYLAELPTQKKDLAAYDLVILGDVPRDLLPDAFLSELADRVRLRGGSLIVIAGRREAYRRLAGTPLARILPVTLDAMAATERGTSEPFSPELTQDGQAHLATRLADTSEENDAVWSSLPPARWAAPVGGLAPGATALLVHPYRIVGTTKMPLLAVQRVGDGKVMFSGLDETWRWRQEVGDPFHYRFWAQVVRWMVKKQFAEGDPRARLSLDRPDCNVGETAQVEAFCLGPDGYPLQDALVSLAIADSAGKSQRVAMQPAPGGWGVYRTSFAPAAPGRYEMQPVVSTYGEQALPSKVTLEVSRMDLEKDFLAQNAAALKSIAEASGGRYLKITEVDELPTLLAARKETRMLRAEFSPCRHWAYDLGLVAVLGAAWLLRKRSGLA